MEIIWRHATSKFFGDQIFGKSSDDMQLPIFLETKFFGNHLTTCNSKKIDFQKIWKFQSCPSVCPTRPAPPLSIYFLISYFFFFFSAPEKKKNKYEIKKYILREGASDPRQTDRLALSEIPKILMIKKMCQFDPSSFVCNSPGPAPSACHAASRTCTCTQSRRPPWGSKRQRPTRQCHLCLHPAACRAHSRCAGAKGSFLK